MNVGNYDVSIRNITGDVRNDVIRICVNVGNDGVAVRSVMTNARIGYMCDLKFRLEAGSYQWSYKSDRTHVEDIENSVQVRPPGGDRLIITLRVETSRDRVSFTSLGDVPLDLGHSTGIESFVGKSSDVGTADSTHIVNCSIALRTD